jgi:hypothetical protein
MIPQQYPVVKVSYAPEPENGKGKAIDKLVNEWACQVVRRAVNQWLYSQEEK